MKIMVGVLILTLGIFNQDKVFPEGFEDKADWTILIYMNGDNDLERDAILDFDEMAKVGSSEEINILVQFDRIGKYGFTTPDWNQTLRFHIQKSLPPESKYEPLPSYAIDDLGEINMGDPQALSEFVAWGLHSFPAYHSMLIIWNHGQGWRDLREELIKKIQNSDQSENSLDSTENINLIDGVEKNIGAPYRSASNDETDRDLLYNQETFEGLKSVLGSNKIDVLGFDACLMAMVETAYAFRDVAHYLVGSEELEPGTGWNYQDLLERIVGSIPKDGATMANTIVASYQATYETIDPTTTLSAIELSGVESLASSIDALSKILEKNLDKHLQPIREARDSIRTYAPGFQYHHIDLGQFVDEIITKLPETEIIDAASRTRNLIKSTVIGNYAGTGRKKSWGSNGLAIYFPQGLGIYLRDPWAEKGYEKSNQRYPVNFVRENSWVDFLHKYLEKVP